jgi:SagB-type dehydrogenase family enzyme
MPHYVFSPMAKISRLDGEARIVIHAGQGANRGHFALAGAGADALVTWLMTDTEPGDVADLSGSLAAFAGMSHEDAQNAIKHLVEADVLIPDEQADALHKTLEPWHRLGWADAANFHQATFNLPFDADILEGLSYPEYYANFLATNDEAGPQPSATTDVAGRPIIARPQPGAVSPASLDTVLSGAAPINRFDGPPVTFAAIMPAIQSAFGVQRTVGGALGEHQLRSFPSGGARHPFELYVVSKGIDGLPEGIFQFDAVSGNLTDLGSTQALRINDACFGKGGILSAAAVAVITCRWLRHSWKYRYARSYRMLLLEVGHIVQALNLSMVSHGMQTYHCPSIDDRVLREMLQLDDDCAEGPVYALGIGHGGVR